MLHRTVKTTLQHMAPCLHDCDGLVRSHRHNQAPTMCWCGTGSCLQLDRTRAYFFWLYIGYFCCEALLAVLSLVWYPPKSQLLLWSPHDEGYLVGALHLPTRT